MAIINPPSFEQAGSYPAANVRQWNKYMMRGGVVSGHAVSQRGAGANMSVDISEGFTFVPGTETTYQGIYGCESQGITNLVISAADPTNGRRDLIIARVRDATFSGATNAWSLEVVTGTPSGSPVDPALPVGSCWILARVTVAALASTIVNANITDLRLGGTGTTGQNGFSSALGGVVSCLSTAKPTIGLYEGFVIYCTDIDSCQVWNGTAWIGIRAPSAPLPQVFQDNLSSGASTTDAIVGTAHNSILTAPYPLTMYVDVRGDCGANAALNTVKLTVADEGGTGISQVTGIFGGGYVTIKNFNVNSSSSFALIGKKDYAAGATCGFRVLYNVDTSNIFVSAASRVIFVPKLS